MIEGIVLVVGSFALAFVPAGTVFCLLVLNASHTELPWFARSALRALMAAALVFAVASAGLLAMVF